MHLLKGPFRFNRESILWVPSKPGVQARGDRDENILDIEFSHNLKKDLLSHFEDDEKRLREDSGTVRCRYFWFWDTWNEKRAKAIRDRLKDEYIRRSAPESKESHPVSVSSANA